MKIHILFRFQKGPWGGGNQFLKALREVFRKKGFYVDNPKNAEIILFNSHQDMDSVLWAKYQFPNAIFIHRVDGPVSLIRKYDPKLDYIIDILNKLVADGTIFQSFWTKEKLKKMFNFASSYETTIHNAPDSSIFNAIDKKIFGVDRKISLIAISWSSNLGKGFELYKFLDEHLDFSKYTMTFVGNSPIKFQNIKYNSPVDSQELAMILKNHDIFITASKNDPCSNSLIEALSCGLPAIVLNSGGHPELVQKGGELFEGEKDVIEKIEKVAKNYRQYQSQLPKFSIERVAQQYSDFADSILKDCLKGKYSQSRFNIFLTSSFYRLLLSRILRKVNLIVNKMS